jgi:hypothetical protein
MDQLQSLILGIRPGRENSADNDESDLAICQLQQDSGVAAFLVFAAPPTEQALNSVGVAMLTFNHSSAVS